MSNTVTGYRKQIGLQNPRLYTSDSIFNICRPGLVSEQFQNYEFVPVDVSLGTIPNCPSDQYTGGTGYCNAGFGFVTTYGFRVCSEVDRSYCDGFDSPPTDVRFDNSQNGNDGSWVRCQYNISAVNSLNSVNNWVTNFGKNDDWYNKIMPSFCFAQTNSCPNNPLNDQPQDSCPRIRSRGAEGDICRIWELEMQQRNPTLLDTSAAVFCQNQGVNDIACRCYNRGLDTNFQRLEATLGAGVDINCWYVPCIDQQYFVLPPDVRNSIENNTCPTTLCTNITSIIAGGNITFTPEQESEITCNLGNNTGVSDLYEFDARTAAVASNNLVDTSGTEFWIFALGLLFVIALIVLVIYLFYS